MSDTPERGELGEFEAGDRAHGAHGKGDSREREIGERTPQPAKRRIAQAAAGKGDLSELGDKLTGELADGAWGSAASGDSAVDALPQKHRGSGGTPEKDQSRVEGES